MKAMKNELTVLSNTFANIPQNVVPNENAQHPIVLRCHVQNRNRSVTELGGNLPRKASIGPGIQYLLKKRETYH
jgi:hypothetical protein